MVNLERLRNACDNFQTQTHLRTPTDEVLAATGEMVLASPTVWWCWTTQSTYPTESPLCIGHGDACQLVNLVPVKESAND